MRIFVALVLALATLGAAAARPEVTLGAITQGRTRAVTVNYTLDRPAIVTVDIFINGERLPLGNVASLDGDVNRYVKTAGAHSFVWKKPQKEIAEGEYQAVYRLTAWATNRPPAYLVYDLANHKTRYYASEDAIPGGIAGDAARKSLLVMRKVDAAGIEWTVGSQTGEALRNAVREAPRRVTLTEDFYLAVYETTLAQMVSAGFPTQTYWTVANTGAEDLGRLPYYTSYLELRGSEPLVNWPATGHAVGDGSMLMTLRAASGVEFDLPTETQWEYACRAGRAGAWYDELSSPTNIAWFASNSGNHAHEVGLKAPNAWGFYDMLGNVNEWCLDWIDSTRSFAEADTVDPVGFASGDGRPTRGGAYAYGADSVRTARRGKDPPSSNAPNMGFRLACPAAAFVEP